MSLCGRPPYQKGSAQKKSTHPTADDIQYRESVRALGCILTIMEVSHICGSYTTTHHAGTGGGGRKNHRKIIPICEAMHIGKDGIDGRKISKRQWQEKYATEAAMLAKVDELLEEKEFRL